jgi:type 1 fimbriae regulatory protein FimB/type 1 fimbriae regulatory protein FimE
MVRRATTRKKRETRDMSAQMHYLGHRNIQHTTRYTELAPDRFKNFWRD